MYIVHSCLCVLALILVTISFRDSACSLETNNTCMHCPMAPRNVTSDKAFLATGTDRLIKMAMASTKVACGAQTKIGAASLVETCAEILLLELLLLLCSCTCLGACKILISL